MIDIQAIESLINQSYIASNRLLEAKYAVAQKMQQKDEQIARVKLHAKIKEANKEQEDKHKAKLTMKTLKFDVDKMEKERKRVSAQLEEERKMLEDVRQEKEKLGNECKKVLVQLSEEKTFLMKCARKRKS